MSNVEQIKARIDCRDVIERDLGKPRYRTSKYSSYKCPLHNEEKGFSLVVYADHWRCFGKCGRGGDAIAWLQEYHDLSFHKACECLASGDLSRGDRTLRSGRWKAQAVSEPPGIEWQRTAHKVAYQAMETLWGRAGRRAWRYLEEERGLTEKSIVDAGLGYIPGHHRQWMTIGGLKVPCGITIPWFAADTLWGIKVRRAAGEQRYQQVRGGHIKDCLYLADSIQPGMPIMLNEGEFDALIAAQVGKGIICAVSIGSSANRDINARWFPKLVAAPRILVRMDEDEAGEGAASQIEGLSQAVRRIQVPRGKDVNEYFLVAGHDAVRNWLTTLIGDNVK